MAAARASDLDGLDLFGVESPSSFDRQYITLRIRRIDRDKLRKQVGAAGATALDIAELAPKMSLDMAMPVVVRKLKTDYGIDVEATVSNVPEGLEPQRRRISEFWPGLVAGIGIGGGSLLIYKGLRLIPSLVRRVLGR